MAFGGIMALFMLFLWLAIFVIIVVSIVCLVKYILRGISLSMLGHEENVDHYGLVWVPIYGYIKEGQILKTIGKIEESWYTPVFTVLAILRLIVWYIILFGIVPIVDSFSMYVDMDYDVFSNIVGYSVLVILCGICVAIALLKSKAVANRIPAFWFAFFLPNCYGFYVSSLLKKQKDVYVEYVEEAYINVESTDSEW